MMKKLFVCFVLLQIKGLTVIGGEEPSLLQLLELSGKEVISQKTGGHEGVSMDMGVIMERTYSSLQRCGSFTQLQARIQVSSNEVVDILANSSVSDIRKAILVRAVAGLDKDSYERLLNDVLKRNRSQNLNPVLLAGLLFPSTKHLRDSWTTHPYSEMRVEFTREAAMVFAANTNMAAFFIEKLRENDQKRTGFLPPLLSKLKNIEPLRGKETPAVRMCYFIGAVTIVTGLVLVGIIAYRKVRGSGQTKRRTT